MRTKVRFGVVRNGEHLAIYSTQQEAEQAAEAERLTIQKAIEDGWINNPGNHPRRVWVEQVRGRVW